MLLNIYLISHPLIKTLSNSITDFNENKNYNHNKYKYLGLFLFYEMFRKHINIYKIYIKAISNIKQVNLLSSKKDYYIITDLLNTYNVIGEIKSLVPEIQVLNYKQEIKFNKNELSKQIILLEILLDNKKIIDLISLLIEEYNINENDILVACIASKNEVLKKMGEMFPNLKIYTTKIF
uniref:Uracil phosphoribosyltransferase n=1 Tax=Platysiphonia delicata TaxID=2006979 RepID=A0A1Z1M0Q6_9FLOR|nr:uracil phosphoribosyltransferase [Platysiphonia delicata]ARW59688.1 uracil phosphoribosyltransferase [Platysiphonia delicata]